MTGSVTITVGRKSVTHAPALPPCPRCHVAHGIYAACPIPQPPLSPAIPFPISGDTKR